MYNEALALPQVRRTGGVSEAAKQLFIDAARYWTHYHEPVASETLSMRFSRLEYRWKYDTELLSNINKITSDKNYLSIISLSYRALPYIFKSMSKEPDYWFAALEAITGRNPVKQANIGDMQAMTQDWLEWAENHGYRF